MSNHDAVWLFVERRSDLHKRFVGLSDVTMRKKERYQSKTGEAPDQIIFAIACWLAVLLVSMLAQHSVYEYCYC